MDRKLLLEQWAQALFRTAQAGGLDNGRRIPIARIDLICGPRAGALEILAGVDAGRLLRILSAHDCALARQFVPWNFVSEPAVFMAGRYVRVEAGWPPGLAETTIRLRDLGQHPKGEGRWIAGKNELGQTVTLGLSDRTPHFLLAGTTGSGKTIALRSAVLQLAKDPANRLVLLDGKFGEGLKPLAHLRGVVGPLAVDHYTTKAALAWALREMRRRYETGDRRGRVVVVMDEPQEFIGRKGDEAVQEMVRRIVAQGRAAQVHLLMATQHPILAEIGGPVIKRNLVGRIALKTMDAKASEVAVGASTPRADYLLGQGDSYCIAPGALHRVQLVYVDESDLRTAPAGEPILEEWPEFAAEDLGQEPDGGQFNGKEIAVSLLNARYGGGRPALQKALEMAGLRKPGTGRSRRLLKLGREVYGYLRSWRYEVCLTD